jgi:hypothetical protein
MMTWQLIRSFGSSLRSNRSFHERRVRKTAPLIECIRSQTKAQYRKLGILKNVPKLRKTHDSLVFIDKSDFQAPKRLVGPQASSRPESPRR